MKRSEKTVAVGAVVSAVVIGAVALSAAAAVVLYFITGYLPLLLAGVIMFMPALVNLILQIPVPQNTKQPEQPKDDAEAEQDKKPFFKRILRALKRLFCRIGRAFRAAFLLFKRKRTAVTAVLVAVSIAVLNYVYWVSVGFSSEHTLKMYVPLVLAGIFVLYIILEKWCKHAAAEGIFGVIIGNLKGVLSVGKFIWLALAVTTVLCQLGLFDPTRILVILLTVYFVYFTVFTVLALAVRLIKQELDTSPDLSVPLPGKKGESMNIISYLEENTGITMRSLWSMKLVKSIVPYAVMISVGVLWLSTGIVQIESNQHGALYRLGKLSDTPLEPGLHLTLPWPFDKVEIYDTDTVKEITVGYLSEEATDNVWTEAHGNNEYKLLLGGGEELVSINLRVHYKIGDLMSYLKNSSAPVSLLESSAYEIVTERTIGTDLDSMLAADRAAFSESFKKELIDRIADYETGLDVVSVVIESIHPPVEIANIYQSIISAEIEAEEIILKAEAQAGVTVATAQKDYYSEVNGAKASSLESIANAEASVAEFMASAEADSSYSDAYRYYKYLNAVKEAYADATLVIVGEGVDSSNLYLGSLND